MSMVKVSRDQATANHRALVAAAGRLFRQRGIDGVSVAELCEAAGMTHGALYSHFGSKDELATEAFTQGQSASRQRMTAAIGEAPDLAAIVDFYVSRRQRENSTDCCPMLASASEAARQSKAFRQSFADGFRDLNGRIQAALEKAGPPQAEDSSMVIAASMIGIVAVARALHGPDPALSNALIAASRGALGLMADGPAAPKTIRKKKPRRRSQHD
jgi:TetR/AcrR family transcriptional repressor of nem operon